MEKLLNLQPGLRVTYGHFMLDFRHNNVRYRVATKISAEKQNIEKAGKLLVSIQLDLERECFHLSNYKKLLSNPATLEKLDTNYLEELSQANMEDLIEEQLKHYQSRVIAKTLAVATYEGYAYIINLHLKPFFHNVSINEVDNLMLEELIKKLPFTRKRISCILRPLGPIFKRAKKQNIIKLNPMDEIDTEVFLTTIVASDYEVKPFSLDEIQKVLANCKHDGIRNLIKFGFWTGMRIGELFALQWSDINFERESISITKSSSTHGLIKAPKTKSGIRDLEMTPQAKEALQDQFKITGNDSDGRVFKTPVNNHVWIKPSAFREYWKEALDKAGVEYRNPYQMRHTFISYMLSIGNSPMVLYRMIGHSNPTIMYSKYARFVRQSGNEKLLKTF